MLRIDHQDVKGVPVLILAGRLDSYGATLLDQAFETLKGGSPRMVVDLAGVEYLSSLGIRSLLAMEKRLKNLSGGVILTGINPFVSQVLELSGLIHRFVCVESREIAVGEALQSAMTGDAAEMEIGGRSYRTTKGAAAVSMLDVWGACGAMGSRIAEESLTSISMEDLGFCFGLGGFGHTGKQAVESLGLLVSAGWMTGLMPADGHGVADFMVVERPSESFVHVAAGIGFSGEPLLYMEGQEEASCGLEEVLRDVIEAVDRMAGKEAVCLGLVILAEGAAVAGSCYRKIEDIPLCRTAPVTVEAGEGLLIIGAVADWAESVNEGDFPLNRLKDLLRERIPNAGPAFSCQGIGFAGPVGSEGAGTMQDRLRELADVNRVRTVFQIEEGTRIRRPRIWVFLPEGIRAGEEKLLRVEVEEEDSFNEAWQPIVRRLYSDAGRVVLRPIHGGYMAETYLVDTYGRDGRRWIPTVLKIAPDPVSRREEAAFHRYVEKTILNNSTAVMGAAGQGEWMGLCYNFVGIGGPESRLTWLSDHVRNRPVEELKDLFQKLLTRILKPWYGQPRWEETRLYEEHDPGPLFPSILEDAQRELSIEPDDENISCTPVGERLPNPYRFLRDEFSRRRQESRLWYRSICHGDLNMQNILLDERDNLYVIDYSETGPGNVVSDFARLEAILKIEMTRLESEEDLIALMRFEQGLCDVNAFGQEAPFRYEGTDPMVGKAYALIRLLRSIADRATVFETDMTPYWLALLQWVLPVVSYSSANPLQKRLAAFSAGLLVRNIQAQEPSS